MSHLLTQALPGARCHGLRSGLSRRSPAGTKPEAEQPCRSGRRIVVAASGFAKPARGPRGATPDRSRQTTPPAKFTPPAPWPRSIQSGVVAAALHMPKTCHFNRGGAGVAAHRQVNVVPLSIIAPPAAAGGGGIRAARVAPGSCLPGAPTDPDVRNYRIRLFESRVRCGPSLSAGFSLTRYRVSMYSACFAPTVP